jgi:hypothetical protein
MQPSGFSIVEMYEVQAPTFSLQPSFKETRQRETKDPWGWGASASRDRREEAAAQRPQPVLVGIHRSTYDLQYLL